MMVKIKKKVKKKDLELPKESLAYKVKFGLHVTMKTDTQIFFRLFANELAAGDLCMGLGDFKEFRRKMGMDKYE